jgi:hypothetical protein
VANVATAAATSNQMGPPTSQAEPEGRGETDKIFHQIASESRKARDRRAKATTRSLTVGIGIAVVAVSAVAAGIFFLDRERAAEARAQAQIVAPPSILPAPSAVSQGQTGTAPATAHDLSLRTVGDGPTQRVNDFLNNGETVADPNNPGQAQYIMATSDDQCSPPTPCYGARTHGFSILYFGKDDSFVVGLSTPELSQDRLAAQQFLQDRLGVSPEDMCKLKISVLTSSGVNPNLAGQELGLGYCPGGVNLP